MRSQPRRDPAPRSRAVRPRFYAYPEGKPHDGYTDFSNHPNNLKTSQDEALYADHKQRGIVIAKAGWQLSQDGVQ